MGLKGEIEPKKASIRISQRNKVLIGHRFFSTFDVVTASKERGDRIYGRKQAYRKASKVQGLQSRQCSLQKRWRSGDCGQAIQKRLPVSEVWPERKDSADTVGCTQVEGYSCGWLDSMVTVLST
jgi:hypothetical protein